MSATFSNNRQGTQSCYTLKRVFGVINRQLGFVFELPHISGRNMDSPKINRFQVVVEKVGQIKAEEGQNGFISRQFIEMQAT